MSKRVALHLAIKAIREARAEVDPAFRGSRFAITVGMSHAHLCNIEAERKDPTEEALHRIAANLRVPVGAISYVIDEPNEATA